MAVVDTSVAILLLRSPASVTLRTGRHNSFHKKDSIAVLTWVTLAEFQIWHKRSIRLDLAIKLRFSNQARIFSSMHRREQPGYCHPGRIAARSTDCLCSRRRGSSCWGNAETGHGFMNFISDNTVGASPRVMAALGAANHGHAGAYGTDDWTGRVEVRFREIFEHDVSVYLTATGTGANAMALACLAQPYESVLTHRESHIYDDECGAPEFFMHGAKLIGLEGIGAKLDPAAVADRIATLPASVKQMQPAALSITQASECGLVYTPQEVAALAAAIRPRGLKLHMDGARFANAVAALGCSPAEITWKAGVDVLTFGGTKNGGWAAEAVIFFDSASANARQMPWRRKRGGHTLSKGRFIGAQFEALLEGGHWLDLARHANAMAARLAAGIALVPGMRLAFPCEANEVFAILPARVDAALRAAGAGYNLWTHGALAPETRLGPGDVIARFVTSFAAQENEIDAFLALIRRAAA